jgi:alkylhydroperoxidase family enzyme
VDEAEVEGLVAEIYATALRRAGRVYNILKLQSLSPAVLRSSIALYIDLMHGPSPLSRAQREMIAVVVSGINECHY